MAAATVTGRLLNDTNGRLRVVAATSIAFASNGDTWTVPGIKNAYRIDFTPTTNTAFGFTVSGNVITLVSGGALTFRGAVQGL